jgi:hypothetical protein
MPKYNPVITTVFPRSQAPAWECLLFKLRLMKNKPKRIIFIPRQAELGNRHSQTRVWEREKPINILPIGIKTHEF